MKTARKIASLVAGLSLITGVAMAQTPSQRYKWPRKSTESFLENILPDKYKSMKLEFLGTIKRSGAGDSYKTNEREFVVTAFYQNGNRELSPEEMGARERTKDNLVGKIKVADYDLMVVYQVCDGNADNKKPILMYVPHEGKKGSSWVFQNPEGEKNQGQFYNVADLKAGIKRNK